MNKDGMMSDYMFYAGNSPININNILGQNGKTDDICKTDLDCSQIKVNSDYSIEYLSNMRCDNPCQDLSNCPQIGTGKCTDIYNLYGI